MTQKVTDPKVIERWVKGAHEYALADRSDPFALNRALAHVRSGVVGYVEKEDKMVEAVYGADIHHFTRRLPDGTEYGAVEWRNMRRP